jgi:hypothetical protein
VKVFPAKASVPLHLHARHRGAGGNLYGSISWRCEKEAIKNGVKRQKTVKNHHFFDSTMVVIKDVLDQPLW